MLASEKDDPEKLLGKFEEQLKINKPNFRAVRLDLHYMYQNSTETLDDFVTRFRNKAADCDFTENEESERIIEQILASTPICETRRKTIA